MDIETAMKAWWFDFWKSVPGLMPSVKVLDGTWDIIMFCYEESHRKYYTHKHIQYCHGQLDEYQRVTSVQCYREIRAGC